MFYLYGYTTNTNCYTIYMYGKYYSSFIIIVVRIFVFCQCYYIVIMFALYRYTFIHMIYYVQLLLLLSS